MFKNTVCKMLVKLPPAGCQKGQLRLRHRTIDEQLYEKNFREVRHDDAEDDGMGGLQDRGTTNLRKS